MAHLKYKAIDTVFPQVLKILTPPSPHTMLYMIWAIAKYLPQHCVGGRGSEHHVLKTVIAYLCVALNRT